MNKNYFLAIPVSFFLTACSGDIDHPTKNGTTPKCTGTPQAPMVTLNLNTMTAKPECVLANPDTTIIFRITPKKKYELNQVEIEPKDDIDPADDWLDGANDNYDDLIIIKVPKGLPPGEYKYGVRTPDDYLDPRVHIEL